MYVAILEDRADQLVLLAGGRVVTAPKTPYAELKYRHFEGNRILYRFGDGMEVQETYNDGIFNCTYRGIHVQARSGDRVAEAISKHHATGDTSTYAQLVAQEYGAVAQTLLLRHMLAGYPERVSIREEKDESGEERANVYVDGGLFMVDAHGNAHVKEGASYRRICVVAQGASRDTTKIPIPSIETPFGPVQMDEATMTVLAKTVFLLEPNLKDGVFVRQLPAGVMATLKARACSKRKRR
jgi:hypothetical protein